MGNDAGRNAAVCEQLAAALGLETEHVDGRGQRHAVSAAVLNRLIESLGSEPLSEGSVGTLVWRLGSTHALPLQASRSVSWQISSGDAEIASGTTTKDGLVLDPPPLPGRYTLRLQADERAEHANLIVCPDTTYQLEDRDAERTWVLAVQLYGVRSRRNWGHGDFTDLRDLLRLAAKVGAAGIGLNPLHALFDDRPQQASPYSPNSRHFLNVLYVDPEAIPEFPGLAASGLDVETARLRTGEEVDYPGVAAAKAKALRLAFERFRERADPARHADFNAFRRERWPALERFAAFEVLRRRFQAVWWEWPEPWRRPTDAAIEALRAETGDELTFVEFVQWTADRQLAACRGEAELLGLPIGLYLDLAVGVEPGGADAWSNQDSIVQQAEVGAPPDMLNLAGQAWGLAALNPRALEAQNFTPFAALVADTMRHAGAIRLDHVLGLNRLYLIPFGARADEGAYVRYPLQALLGVIALHSAESRCAVIGEDLGTVPPELRDVLADWGVWSYLVMMFERADDGTFKPPETYKRNALVTFATHDLPTFAGWFDGHDLKVKRGLGLDPGETDDERSRARWLAGEALGRESIVQDRAWSHADIARFLARTPSRVMAVSIEDVLGVLDQPNIPGTMDEHPNWRRRLPLDLDAIAAHPELRAVAQALAEEGRAVRGQS